MNIPAATDIKHISNFKTNHKSKSVKSSESLVRKSKNERQTCLQKWASKTKRVY